MKCDECQMLVQEYFDGELDPLTAAELSIHTESCSLCSAALEQLTLEQRIYQEYDRELDVSPALWMKVREQLAEADSRQNRTWFRRPPVNLSRLLSFPFRMAASATVVLLVFAVTGVVIKYLNRHETSKPLALSSDLVSQQLAPTPPNESVKPKRPGSRVEWSEIKRSIAVGSRPAHAGRPALRAYTRETTAPAQLVRKAEKQYLRAIALLARHEQNLMARSLLSIELFCLRARQCSEIPMMRSRSSICWLPTAIRWMF
jgi:hypothetical protein